MCANGAQFENLATHLREAVKERRAAAFPAGIA
jgi:hypothetical protein